MRYNIINDSVNKRIIKSCVKKKPTAVYVYTCIDVKPPRTEVLC